MAVGGGTSDASASSGSGTAPADDRASASAGEASTTDTVGTPPHMALETKVASAVLESSEQLEPVLEPSMKLQEAVPTAAGPSLMEALSKVAVASGAPEPEAEGPRPAAAPPKPAPAAAQAAPAEGPRHVGSGGGSSGAAARAVRQEALPLPGEASEASLGVDSTWDELAAEAAVAAVDPPPAPPPLRLDELDVLSLLRRADAELEQGLWDAAKETCSSTIRRDRRQAEAWAGRGKALLRQGHLTEAREDLTEACRLKPGLPGALADLSEVKLRLFLAPLDAPALCERGKSKLEAGDWSGAIIDLGLAVRLGHPEAGELLGRAKAEAFSCY